MVKMSLVTVQRSPSGTGSLSDDNTEEGENCKYEKSECFFTGKGTALILALREIPHHIAERRRSLDAEKCSGNISSANLEIQQHLQSMFYLLRHEDTLKMAVKLESQRPNRTRYLAIISRTYYKKNNNNGLSNISSGSRLLLSRKSKKSTYQRDNEIQIQKDNNKHETTTTATILNTTATSNANSILFADTSIEEIAATTMTTSTPTTTQSTANDAFNNTTTTTTTNTREFEENSRRQEIETSSSLIDSDQNLNNNNNNTSNSNTNNNNKISTTKRNINCDISCVKKETSSRTDSIDELEESCLLGIDCNEKTTIGLVLKVLADTTIRLDGDGGFSISIYGKTHIFKPVSVQAMWSALQTLHKVSQKARNNNFYPGGPSHEWVSYYENRIDSDRSCLNEWNTMDNLESRRPPSPDAIENKPTEREETKQVIRMKLKEIMMSVDLDEVTSKYIRGRLEELLDMDLGEYKSFIDEEMLMILGQMDAPTEIFEHVYLGSEWNASNLEELQRNGVGHILNVTREIDNFFPGMFDYFNVRVYDDEKTNLLKYWDNTYKYISRVKAEGSKVLVHCKMGVSRSASVVIAYAMKAYNWDFNQALQHVKERRNCVKPNKSFLAQLETYRGMLDAMQNKEKLQRSKSETNLKSSTKDARLLPGSEPTPLIQALNNSQQQQQQQQQQNEEISTRTVVTEEENEKIDVSEIEEENLVTSTFLVSSSLSSPPLSPSPSIRSLPSSSISVSASASASTSTSVPLNIRRSTTIKRSNSSLASRNFVNDEHSITQSSSSSSSDPMTTMMSSKHQSVSLEDLSVIHDQKNNVLYPAENGQNYSLTQNQIRHIQQDQQQESDSNYSAMETTDCEDMETQQSSNQSNNNASSSRNIINLPSSPLLPSNIFLHQCDSITSSSNDLLLSSSSLISSSSPSHGIYLSTSNKDNNKRHDTTTVSVPSSSSSSVVNENLIWTSSSQLIRQSTNIDLAATTSAVTSTADKSSSAEAMNQNDILDQPQEKDEMITTTTAANDYFSSQLDNIFETEETKTTDCNFSTNTNNNSKCTTISNQTWTQTNPLFIDSSIVSRQSSCSSVDSAVFVGGYSGEITDIPSRQSSWGSGDNRILPSRNSSWGSYDTNRSATVSNVYRNFKQLKNYGGEQTSSLVRGGSLGGIGLEDEKDELILIPSGMESVKRTKQKLEENSSSSLKKLCGGDDKLELMTNLSQNVNVASTCVTAYTATAITTTANASTSNADVSTANPASVNLIMNTDQANNNQNISNEQETISKIFASSSLSTTSRSNSEENVKIVEKERGRREGENIRKLEKLSASAPETFSIEKFARVVQKQQQEQQQKYKKKTAKQMKIENESHVQNLKKNFEAKATTILSTTIATNFSKQKGHQSLPSSPIATHSGHNKDLNVKDLVTKYQSSEPLQQQQQRQHQHSIYTNRIRPRSYYESRTTTTQQLLSGSNSGNDLQERNINTSTSTASVSKFIRNKKDAVSTAVAAITAAANNEQKQKQKQQLQQQRFSIGEINRPPPIPPPVPKIPINHHQHHHHHHHHHTSMTDGILSENFHQRKVQHYGKTHPLARLSFCKKKLNSAATYNTM